MKRILTILLLALSIGNVRAQQSTNVSKTVSTGEKKQKDKAFLSAYFQQTYDALERSVTGLSAAQLNFKPSPEQWSINQCLEHIVLTERMLFDEAQKNMQSPASPKRRKDVKVSDEEIIKGISDRSHKAKAPDALIGEGKYSTASQALEELERDRKLVFDYLSPRSLDDMRNHVSDTPFGATDGYHSFLYIAGHTARHTGQIEALKAEASFPQK
jgi:uncharacterized damage-inducible protein DinB